MSQRFDPANKGVLLNPERKEHLDPDRVISLLPIRPYHKVADIGCGPGFFAIPLAKYVSQGRLYALDTQEEMAEACREKLARVHLTNVDVLLCQDAEFPLEKESLDGAFAAFVLHEAQDRAGFLKAVHGLLQKGGWLAVMEWYKREMEEGPPLEQRMAEEEVRELAGRAGLRFVSLRDLNSKHYMMQFRK
ncbi:MAG: class I SAM-dependent methyltransferase [Chloroflexi bacterium]|nr:class I SAM-dependent methyltransferase [Chloroflexota bacterium]